MLVKIKLVRSPIGCPEDQRKTLFALKLRRLGKEKVIKITPQIEGMLRKVHHLVKVEEAKDVEQA